MPLTEKVSTACAIPVDNTNNERAAELRETIFLIVLDIFI
ncbi:hypothetical protein B6N60_04906 [Richelia sinica FACHB-800]|uniref:Uncharacterized protein n=1 Tax=Richelia sinica FACHB-800 TaxID=1357546 RepID=A0A975Y7B9_9NOST|nr:hypothetical protein B6N60_04906 [Richelia sinica FACHB-800]